MIGAIEVQIGSNNDVCFGGHNVSRAHLGLCLRQASLSIDGAPVIARGAFVPKALR